MDVRTIGVIGAGPTGRRIALAAIRGGYHVILEDVSPDILEEGVAFIEDSLSRNGTREAVAPNRETGTLAQLSTLGRADELCRQADFLIETTPEELEVKLEIFTIYDKFAKPGAILASHTRLSITDLAAITFRSENCVAMCFFDGGQQKASVEVVAGLETSDATVAACVEVARRMLMECTAVREQADSPIGAEPRSEAGWKGASE
jgi:3-hydroxybutyryl-CoA dehydrogenase